MRLSPRTPVVWCATLVVLVVLAGCGGSDGSDGPSGSASRSTAPPPTQAGEATSEDPNGEEATDPAAPTRFAAFEIAGSFPGAVVSTRRESVLVRGQGDEDLGETLDGLSLYSASGVLRATTGPSTTPCAATLAGAEEDVVVTNEVAFLEPEGTLEGGTRNTLRFYDGGLAETKAIELPEYRGDARELWQEPTANGGCTAAATGDGRYVVTYDAAGWYVVDVAALTAELVLPHYAEGRDDDLPARLFPLGSELVSVPSRVMLAPVDVSVVDPATREVVQRYPLYDDTAEEDTPEGSREARLASAAADADWLVDPAAPAVVYTYETQDADFAPISFDLATGTVTTVGPAGLAAAPRLDPAGDTLYFVDDSDGDPVLRAYSADGGTELWSAANVTDVCTAVDDQVVVAANDQLVLLDKATGEQLAYDGDVATTGIFGGSACAPVNVAGFGWGIDDDAVQGDGGAIVSYVDQDGID